MSGREKALRRICSDLPIVQVSNYIGFMLDSALELGVKKLIIGGHPGKLAKLAAGIMQTHSKYADGRREAIITQLALIGADVALLQKIQACVTTDAIMVLVEEAGLDAVWNRIAEAVYRYSSARVRGEIGIDVIVTDTPGNEIGRYMEGTT